MPTGADRLAHALARQGVSHAFGLPGTQSIPVFEGLRRSAVRTVLATHELNAAFMAVGYFRASGRPAALVTIPGPGFTHALSGLVEARHDSAGLIHVVNLPEGAPGGGFVLQAVHQSEIGELETKGVFTVRAPESLERTVEEALARAMSGEPGPVVLQVASEVLHAVGPPPSGGMDLATGPSVDLREAEALVQRARRAILLVGQGAASAADAVVGLAEILGAPVITSCSARGLIPEDHPLAMGFDSMGGSAAVVNELLRSSDCVLVLGYKLTHNGTMGHRLELPPDVTVRVDADREVLSHGPPYGRSVQMDAGAAVRRLTASCQGRPAGDWSADEVQGWRRRMTGGPCDPTPEPRVHGSVPPTPAAFLGALRSALPRDAIVVTDSGLHQNLVRRYFTVLSPRGLIVPSDYQSMGFGVPAAIGAKLAAPDRAVVAVVGDGGLAMTGMELLTAVRERIGLTVIVFNDGYLNLIRLQQLGAYGQASSVRLRNPDFELLAHAVGAEYRIFEGTDSLGGIGLADKSGVTLLEVRLGDPPAVFTRRQRGLVGAAARRALGPRLAGMIRRWLR